MEITTPRSPVASGSSFDISAAASRSMLKEPIRLTLITLSKSASGIGPSRPITRLATPMPAQFTSTRAGPWALDAAAMAASADAASATSQTTATPLISAATAFGEFGVEVAHRDLGALRREPARGGGAQSRCAAGDDGGLILQLHDILPGETGFEFG